MPTRIALLTGGISSERDVALASAAHVQKELAQRFEITSYDIPHDLERFLKERWTIDLAIPLFHGVGGEDGSIQGFLKTLNIPFVFSDITAHAIGMDKAITKDILVQRGIKTASYIILAKDQPIPPFTQPCVIKPLDGGSSIGITITHDKDAYHTGIIEGFRSSKKLLIEDYISGREFTVAIVEQATGLVALPVIEIKTKHAFFDLESKYDPTLAEEICPAELSEALANQLKYIALQTHLAIGAKHLSRTDIIVDNQDQPWVLEINTIPGQTKNSLLPKALRAASLTMTDVYTHWIQKELVMKDELLRA